MENVFFYIVVDKSNVEFGVGVSNDERSFGVYMFDKVDLVRVDKIFVFIGIVFVIDGDFGKGGILFVEVGDDSMSVDVRDGGNIFVGILFV